ncbi:uncharacterized protein [Rutidosis leptorrhynchoides]|uniref:uncharacterized protein n=1 Tax=Rutidosis leptorrhynchoides TaxID=125765 RepID=UPI003A99A1B0
MWHDLNELLTFDNVMWVIFGDFNEVRFANERKNTIFIERRAELFNDFIKKNNLLDIPLGGRIYTRISNNGVQFSKLDRFLVSENFIHQWPNINAMVFDKKHTDHCPIILRDGNTDFGPKPIKVFDEWINHKDARDIILKAWDKRVSSWKPDLEQLTKAIIDWELKAESNDLTEEQMLKWVADKEQLILKEKNQLEMLKQKARFKWALEGDENSKFFHSFIQRRQQKNNIHGVYVNGLWSTNPSDIKSEAHNFFKKL